jgi:hypothetical protein
VRVRAAIPFAAYLFLAVAFVWIWAGDPSAAFVGRSGGDLARDAWDLWWFRHSLIELGQWPLETALLNHPDGAVHWCLTPLTALMSVPVQALVGLPMAYNLSMALHLALACVGAYLLCREVSGDRAAALLGGVAYGFSPYLLSHVYNGMHKSMNAAWIPLCLLFLLRAARGRNAWFDPLLAGLCFALASAGGYHALVALILGLGIALANRRTLGRQGRALAAGVLLAAPAALMFAWDLAARDSSVPGRTVARPLEAILTKSTSLPLDRFLLPNDFPPGAELLSQYLGWSLLILAVLGVRRDLRAAWPWLAGAGVSLLLACGYFLAWGDGLVTLGGHRVPLPLLAVYELVPGGHLFWYPHRMLAGVALGLAVLASLGLRELMDRVPWRRAAVAVACALVLVESLVGSGLPAPPASTSYELAPIYARIANEPGDGAVIELPFAGTTRSFSDSYAHYFLTQTVHGRPTPLNFLGMDAPPLERNELTRYLMSLEHAHGGDGQPGSTLLKQGAEQLRQEGFGWLLLHSEQYEPMALARALTALNATLGNPEREGTLVVYRLVGSP